MKSKREKVNEYAISKEDNEITRADYFQRIPDLELYIVNLLDPKENNNNNTVEPVLFLKILMELEIDILI